jgi:hypothetical protein
VHHEPPEATWPLPELDAGVDDGELRPPLEEDLPEDELPDEAELPDELDLLAPRDAELVPPAVEVARWAPPAAAREEDAADAAPGRVNATAPAATRLAAVAEAVTARSRRRPRSLAAIPAVMPRRGVVLCLLMPASVAAGLPMVLEVASQAAQCSGTRGRPPDVDRLASPNGPSTVVVPALLLRERAQHGRGAHAVVPHRSQHGGGAHAVAAGAGPTRSWCPSCCWSNS